MASVRVLHPSIMRNVVEDDANSPMFGVHHYVENIEITYDGGRNWVHISPSELEQWLEDHRLELVHSGHMVANATPSGGLHAHYLQSRREANPA